MADVRFRDLDPVTSVTIDQLFAMGKEVGTDSNKATAPQVWRWVAEELSQGVVTPLTTANLGKYNIPGATSGSYELQMTLGDTLPIGADLLVIQTQDPATHTLTVSSVAGVTINAIDAASIPLSSQGDGIRLHKIATNEYMLQYLSSENHGDSLTLQDAYDNGSATIDMADTKPISIESFDRKIISALIDNGGSGYTIGDILTVAGGTFTTVGELRVAAVSSGVITDIEVYSSGTYKNTPSNPVATTGGTGLGATFNLSYGAKTAVEFFEEWLQVSSGISIGDQPLASYAAANFNNNGPFNKCIVMPIINATDEARISALSPTNGSFWYNLDLDRFRAPISNTPKTIPFEEDITLDNAYSLGDGSIQMTDDKPLEDKAATSGQKRGRIPPSMDSSEFGSIPSPVDGEMAWATDLERILIHDTQAPVSIKQVAFLDDISAIEEDVIYGDSFFQGNSTETVIAAQSVPVKVNGVYSSDLLQGFLQSGGTLTYNELPTRVFKVTVSLTVAFESVTNPITVFLAKDGNVLAKSGQSPDLDGVTDSYKSVSTQGIVSLDQGNTLEVFIQNDGGTQNIIVKDLVLIAHAMGGVSDGSGADIQQVWDNSVTGAISVVDGGKYFSVRKQDGITEIAKFSDTEININEQTSIISSDDKPLDIKSEAGKKPEVNISDNNTAANGIPGTELILKGLDTMSNPYDFMKLSMYRDNSTSTGHRTSIILSSTYDTFDTEILRINSLSRSLVMSQTFTPVGLTTPQVAAWPKLNGMIYRNSTDNRISYWDNIQLKEKKIATLDDIVTDDNNFARANKTGSTTNTAPYYTPMTSSVISGTNEWNTISGLDLKRNYAITSVSLNAAGTGYAVNDEVQIDQGAPYSVAERCTIRVDSIGGGGSIATFTIVNQGKYHVSLVPSTVPVVSVPPGTGSGATFNVLTTSNVEERNISNFSTGGFIVGATGTYQISFSASINVNSSANINHNFSLARNIGVGPYPVFPNYQFLSLFSTSTNAANLPTLVSFTHEDDYNAGDDIRIVYLQNSDSLVTPSFGPMDAVMRRIG